MGGIGDVCVRVAPASLHALGADQVRIAGREVVVDAQRAEHVRPTGRS